MIREWRPILRVARAYLPFAKPYRNAILVSVFWVFIRVSIEMFRPWPLKLVIDQVLKGQKLSGDFRLAQLFNSLSRESMLGVSCSLILLTALAYAFFSWKSASRINAIGQRMICDIRRAVYRHLQALPLAFFERNRTGEIIARVHTDISNVEDLLVAIVNVFLVNSLIILGVFAMLVRVDARFALIAAVVLPAMYLTARYYIHSIKTSQRLVKARDGEIASLVQENVSQIRTVHAYAQDRYEAARFEIPARGALEAGLRASGLQARLEPSIEVLTALGTLLIVAFGARQVLRGEMTLGTLIVVLTYLQALYSPIRLLARMVNTLNKAVISAERVCELLDEEPEDSGLLQRRCPELRGEIEFRNVSFIYPSHRDRSMREARPALRSIHLKIEAGMTVAIIGTTGSGKTTLSSLIPRLYSPTSGKILLDGMDLETLDRKSLRQQIGVLPQDAALFRATVWENIAYGARDLPAHATPRWFTTAELKRQDPDLMRRILEASQQANANEFIENLPDGYDTILTERGANLSGGQRQRVAIARALLRDAPILIMDEPTTGLDSASTLKVMQAIERLQRGRTCLVIAHHLGTIRNADRIVVIEDGEITEQGTHGELDQPGSKYRSFLDLAV